MSNATGPPAEMIGGVVNDGGHKSDGNLPSTDLTKPVVAAPATIGGGMASSSVTGVAGSDDTRESSNINSRPPLPKKHVAPATTVGRTKAPFSIAVPVGGRSHASRAPPTFFATSRTAAAMAANNTQLGGAVDYSARSNHLVVAGPKRTYVKLTQEQLKMHCLEYYKRSQFSSSLRQYCRENGILSHRNSIQRLFCASGLKDLKAQNVPWGSQVQDAMNKFLQERDKKIVPMLPTPPDDETGKTVVVPLENHQLRTHSLEVYKLPPKVSFLSYCKENDIVSNRHSVQRALVASGLKIMKEQGVPCGRAVEEALDEFLASRGKLKPADDEQGPPQKRRKLSKRKEPAKSLDNDELRHHCIQLYKLPPTGAILAYCKEHKIESSRLMLMRALDASGLKALKEQEVPFGPTVEEAMDKFMEARSKKQSKKRKRQVLEEPSQGPPLKRISRVILKFLCCDFYQKPGLSVRAYCQKKKILDHRQLLSKAFVQSGLSSMLEKEVKFGPSVLEKMDEYLDKKQNFPDGTVELSNIDTGATTKKVKHLDANQLRHFCYQIYEMPPRMTLLSYCKQNNIETYRNSLQRVFANSGLQAMKAQGVPFGEDVEVAMDKYLAIRETNNPKSIKQLYSQVTPQELVKTGKRLSLEQMKYYCCDFYHMQGMCIREYCEKKEIPKQRGSFSQAMNLSGLSAMKKNKIPFSSVVVDKLDQYLNRKFKILPDVQCKETIDTPNESGNEPAQMGPLNRDQLQEHCFRLYNLSSNVSFLSYCKQNHIESRRQTLQRIFAASGLKEMKEKGVPFGSDVKYAMTKYLEGRKFFQGGRAEKQASPATSKVAASPQASNLESNEKKPKANQLTVDQMRYHCLEYYQSPADTSFRSYCKKAKIENHRKTFTNAYVSSGLKEMKERNVPLSALVKETLENYLNKRPNTPAERIKQLVAAGSAVNNASVAPTSEDADRRLSQDEIKEHCLSFYQMPCFISLRQYLIQKGIESKRGTLGRAYLKSGLKEMKERGVPYGPTVVDAMNKFVESKQAEKEARKKRRKQS